MRFFERFPSVKGGRLAVRSTMRDIAIALTCAAALAACAAPGPAVPGVDDSGSSHDRAPAPLTSVPGDAARGRETFAARTGGHCVLCHRVPDVAAAGDVGPELSGVGTRLDAAQLRFRIVDITRLKPDAVMPAFYRTDGLRSVAPEYRGRTALSAQQVEDVVAYLETLR
jgi:L-cysteine S-thiosulfotransferase